MLGTKQPAEQGALVFLAAGAEELRERVAPAFEAMGSKTIWVSEEPGRGSALKLVCNAFVGTLTAAIGQSVGLATQLGLDPQLFLDALDGGASDSPYVHVKGGMMLTDEYPPSFALDGVRKDLGLIRAGEERSGTRPTLTEAVLACFDAAAEQGHGADDMAAVVAAFRELTPTRALADREDNRSRAAQLSAAVRTAACSSQGLGLGVGVEVGQVPPTDQQDADRDDEGAGAHDVRGGRADGGGEDAGESRGDGAPDEADPGVGRRRDRARQLGGLHHRLGEHRVHHAEEQPTADGAADQDPEAVHEQGHRREVEGQQQRASRRGCAADRSGP